MAKSTLTGVAKKVLERKKKEERSNVTFRLRKDLVARLKRHSQRHKVSMALILEELIERWDGS